MAPSGIDLDLELLKIGHFYRVVFCSVTQMLVEKKEQMVRWEYELLLT